MGQQEVLDFLKKKQKNKKWYTSREISKAIGISIGSVTASLKKLRKSNWVRFRQTGHRKEFEYRYRK